MMKPHKHAELIKAWADGAEIEVLCGKDYWEVRQHPNWHPDDEFRIKPEPKPEPEKQWMYIYNNAAEGKTWISPITPDYYKGVVGVVYMGKIEVFK